FPAAPDLRFAPAFLRSAVAVFFLMPAISAAPLTTCTAASPTAERRSASRASLRRSSHSLQLMQLSSTGLKPGYSNSHYPRNPAAHAAVRSLSHTHYHTAFQFRQRNARR